MLKAGVVRWSTLCCFISCLFWREGRTFTVDKVLDQSHLLCNQWKHFLTESEDKKETKQECCCLLMNTGWNCSYPSWRKDFFDFSYFVFPVIQQFNSFRRFTLQVWVRTHCLVLSGAFVWLFWPVVVSLGCLPCLSLVWNKSVEDRKEREREWGWWHAGKGNSYQDHVFKFSVCCWRLHMKTLLWLWTAAR